MQRAGSTSGANRLKARHERFCRGFVECANATLAAKMAGYAPQSARNAGYRLLHQPRIIHRINEIQQEMAQAHCRDLDVLLGKLETIYRRAVDDRHFSAATRAVELQAKLTGVAANPRVAGRIATASKPTEPADDAPQFTPARRHPEGGDG